MDFAYKYPFSDEAKQIISEQKIDSNNAIYLNIGKIRVEEALKNNRIEYLNIGYDSGKLEFIISYVFARIIISALKNYYLLDVYVDAEVKRCIEAMQKENNDKIIYLANQLKININLKYLNKSILFSIPISELLKNNKHNQLNLVNLGLNEGLVYLKKFELLKIIEEPIKKSIKKNLPISQNKIPKQAFEYARQIKIEEFKAKESEARSPKQYIWIEKLINIPIPDVRHRIVNLILAPYFINIRNFDEQRAFEIISEYIEKCKQLEGNTKINDSYIKYQCRYAKNKKLRPLSFERAKELLNSVLNLDDLKN
ncbi:MAG: DNA primase noncatalytic subunit PriX [Candidatus Marsarchaeota archaeon]|nr:DNA primase noncatalytic subunit PriX [Candidatus Marsarchaeota archaeon]MCL5094408.1 DNA primase noncatalytic subunit PriX [Candidatus Marsarchaeota archaeon]